jgi:hypothetical protein
MLRSISALYHRVALFDTLVNEGKSRRGAGDAAGKLPLCR